MKYKNIVKCRFIKRINRFIAEISINGYTHLCHVKNTGRCKELLIEGVNVYVEENFSESRKTKYSLICVEKGSRLINMDSQVPNKVVFDVIYDNPTKFLNIGEEKLNLLKREVTFENSRFDLYFETDTKKGFIEVKGVTLEKEGIVKFPDAPTIRGVKHINELIIAKKKGFDCYIFLVIQMKDVIYFTPNKEMHKEFYDILKIASEEGVNILAYDCNVTQDEIDICSKVEVKF